LLAGLVLALAHAGLGYDIPDFNKVPFSADGISGASESRAELLAALVALAANFPGSKAADEDLSEKALALALRLDPFHEDARAAHAALKRGRTPTPTPYFESLSSASEALWRASRTFAKPEANPDEHVLAPYLAELSLVVHPEPADARILEFAALKGEKPSLKWSDFVSLHQDSPSGERVRDLARREQQLREMALVSRPADPLTKNPASSASPPDAAPDVADDPSTRRIFSRSVIAAVEGPGGVYPVAGRFELEVQIHSASRMKRIKERAADPLKTVAIWDPVVEGSSALSLEALPLTSSDLEARGIPLPPNFQIELGFHPIGALSSSARLNRVVGASLLNILLREALDPKDWSAEFQLVEEFPIPPDPDGRKIASTSLQTCFASSPGPFALIPASMAEPLLAMLLETEDLSLLFAKELISAKDNDAVVSLLSQPSDPALTSASAAFAEIKAVAGKMTLVDFARNPKVQERLDDILDGYPNHLSARLMLEFGRAPISAASAMRPFFEQIDGVINPYFTLDDSSSNTSVLAASLEADSSRLFKLRSEIPLEARDYLDASEDLLAAAKLFLGLTNKTSAIGEQRLRETLEAIAVAKAARAKLGTR